MTEEDNLAGPVDNGEESTAIGLIVKKYGSIDRNLANARIASSMAERRGAMSHQLMSSRS